MRIDIWSDVVCPWCYLGSRRLGLALERLGQPSVMLRWRAFQLDPTAPPEPRDLRRVIEAKYGPGTFGAMTGRLGELGAAVGIDYRFDRAVSVNTRDAHRLLAWAGTVGGGEQDALARELFRRYFTDGEDVSDHSVLAAAAAAAGLDTGSARSVLGGDAHAAEVDQDRAEAMDRGISGVPTFVVDGTFSLPGAQEVDRLVQLLVRAGASPSG